MTSIIEQAIHLEVTAEANYREAARSTLDASAGRILELLADEEANHARVLRGMGDVSDLADTGLLDQAKAWINGVVEGGRLAISHDSGLLNVLRRAMDMEQMTQAFYEEQRNQAENEKTRVLFERLAAIETTHFHFVGSLVEFYNRPNEWVESAEFGLRNEY
jgi:rubrerythrin